MKRVAKVLFGLAVVALMGGLASTLFVGRYHYTGSVVAAQVYHGSVSVLGNHARITVRSGSRVDVLTLAGANNTVVIESGAEVTAIRGVGMDNTVITAMPDAIDTRFVTGTTVRGSEAAASSAAPGSLDGL